MINIACDISTVVGNSTLDPGIQGSNLPSAWHKKKLAMAKKKYKTYFHRHIEFGKAAYGPVQHTFWV
jgi:hypothetical protein